MSEQRPRRLGRADRKKEIRADRDFLKKDIPNDLPDLSMLARDEADEVDQLASLSPGVIARPLKIAPPEERFPPVAPATYAIVPAQPAALSQPPAKPPRRTGLNVLTLLLLLGTVGVWAGVAAIWQDPYHWLNPLPPPVVRVFVTATFLPPTPTSDTPAPTLVPAEPPFYQLQDGSVRFMANENGRGCAWASIAGSVTTAGGQGVNGLRVQIVGEGVNSTVFSGSTAAFGPGGFEFPLGEAPVESAFMVQLVSLDDAPLSEVVTVETRPTCEENVALLAFIAP